MMFVTLKICLNFSQGLVGVSVTYLLVDNRSHISGFPPSRVYIAGLGGEYLHSVSNLTRGRTNTESIVVVVAGRLIGRLSVLEDSSSVVESIGNHSALPGFINLLQDHLSPDVPFSVERGHFDTWIHRALVNAKTSQGGPILETAADNTTVELVYDGDSNVGVDLDTRLRRIGRKRRSKTEMQQKPRLTSFKGMHSKESRHNMPFICR